MYLQLGWVINEYEGSIGYKLIFYFKKSINNIFESFMWS